MHRHSKLSLVLFVLGTVGVAWLWSYQPRAGSEGSTEFSSWSKRRTVASEGAQTENSPVQPQRVPQNETVPRFDRAHIDTNHLHLPARRSGPGQGRALSPNAEQALAGLPRVKAGQTPDAIDEHGPYEILGAVAVPASDYRPSMGDVLLEQGDYLVVLLDPSRGDDWKNLTVRPETRPLVVNPAKNNRLAVVTGTLLVKLKTLEAVSAIADSEKLRVLGVDENIRTVYYKAPPGYSLLEGLQRLRARPEVEHAELELDQSRREGM